MQKAEEAWINQDSNASSHAHVKSTFKLALVERLLPCKSCLEVLKSRKFKNTLNKKAASDENLVYVNKCFQNPVYAELFLAHRGLRALLENVSRH